MGSYSLRMNLSYMAMMFSAPRRLVACFSSAPSIGYGIVPFLLYTAACEVGWLGAYVSGYQQAISPMPKLLPIPDDRYMLYQAIFGPFVKAACYFLFGGCLWLMARAMRISSFPLLPAVTVFAFVGNTMGLVAFVIDQAIIWSGVQGGLRFVLSTIHPIAMMVDAAFVIAYVRRYACISIGKACAVVIPAVLVAVPVVGMMFR